MAINQKVLARKWRPRDFASVVGQESTRKALQHALATQQLHHAYLFTGTRGVGKTTMARILAKCLNCEQGVVEQPCGNCSLCRSIDNGDCVDVIEVDAASRTKVEDTRELLDNVPYAPVHGRYKIYIIDEVHMLSKHSFNALLKTLEEPPEHVKFILATTDPQKLPDTVLSRCLQFHLRSLTIEQIEQQLQYILQQEQISFELEALTEVAKSGKGSMRDALSLLEQVIAYSERNITLIATQQILGTATQNQTLELLKQIIAGDAQQALEVVKNLAAHNADFNVVLKELQTLIYQTAMAQIGAEGLPAEIIELSKQVEAVDLQTFYQTALLGVRDLPYAPELIIGFEMIVLRMIAFQPILSMEDDSVNERQSTMTTPAKAVPATKSAATESKVQAKQTAADMPITTPAVTESKTQATPAVPAKRKTRWEQIITKLNLTGISKMIAEHSTVHIWQNDRIVLILNEAQKPMLNDKHVQRIKEALQEYTGKRVQLEINAGATQSPPPAIAKQNAAEQSIQGDTNIQQFAQVFDAKISEIKVKEE